MGRVGNESSVYGCDLWDQKVENIQTPTTEATGLEIEPSYLEATVLNTVSLSCRGTHDMQCQDTPRRFGERKRLHANMLTNC